MTGNISALFLFCLSCFVCIQVCGVQLAYADCEKAVEGEPASVEFSLPKDMKNFWSTLAPDEQMSVVETIYRFWDHHLNRSKIPIEESFNVFLGLMEHTLTGNFAPRPVWSSVWLNSFFTALAEIPNTTHKVKALLAEQIRIVNARGGRQTVKSCETGACDISLLEEISARKRMLFKFFFTDPLNIQTSVDGEPIQIRSWTSLVEVLSSFRVEQLSVIHTGDDGHLYVRVPLGEDSLKGTPHSVLVGDLAQKGVKTTLMKAIELQTETGVDPDPDFKE